MINPEPRRFKFYNAGHMLTKGAQMQRQAEKEEILALDPYLSVYDPKDNKEINDKANAVQEGLAERIVKHDTDAIISSDIIIIEPLPEALGTHVELGQIKGMRDFARRILAIARQDSNEFDNQDKYWQILNECHDMLNKEIYPHYEDVRRFDGAVEAEDRRSWGINQYVYGVCLDLTNGKGLYSWDEIKGKLSEKNRI